MPRQAKVSNQETKSSGFCGRAGLADFVVLAMPQTPQSEGMIGMVRGHHPPTRFIFM